MACRSIIAALAAAGAAACMPPPAAPAQEPAGGYDGPPGAYGEAEGAEPGRGSGSETGSGPETEAVTGRRAETDPEPEPEPEPETAAGPDQKPRGMTSFEAGVAAKVNRLRRDPAGFAADLERHRRNYHDNYLFLPGVEAPILTAEGVAAVDEAIVAARRARPRPVLRISRGLSAAARAHAVEIGRAGTVEHDGRDGSQPHQRMERHGRIVGLSGENIGTGWGDAGTMVMSLFIDDGVAGRGHRVNLLEPEYRVIGVGCSPHKRFGTVCVLDLAAGFRE